MSSEMRGRSHYIERLSLILRNELHRQRHATRRAIGDPDACGGIDPFQCRSRSFVELFGEPESGSGALVARQDHEVVPVLRF
jgi:hypothetical protein